MPCVSIRCDIVHCDGVCRDITCPGSACVGQRSEDEDPEAVSLSSPLCAAPVDLLDPPHLQILRNVVQLAKVGYNWFLCFLCSYVRAVSVHPDMEGVLRFSNILLAALPA